MEELETMKAKKQELLERNNRLKENQDKPQRDYSNSVTRSAKSGVTINNSGGVTASQRKQTMSIGQKVGTEASVSAQKSPVGLQRVTLNNVASEEKKTEIEVVKEETAAEVDAQINQMEIKHEPGKLDLAFEQALEAHQAVDNIVSKKYLVFRPYIDPMTLRPHKPPDKGYYFKFYNNVNVPLIRYTLEDNGFREISDRNQEWLVSWACSNIKS